MMESATDTGREGAPPARPKPEVLAPAGDERALAAAVRAGADAVYFGLQDWNARVRARNFELGGLAATIRELHRDGVRAYVTFNTLLFGGEQVVARDALERIAQAGPDALIVQDLGVARWIREHLPSVTIHASTQMTVSSVEGVDFLRRFRVGRVILARELTIPEIRRIRSATDVELEVFVHGALCVSYSGQCLSSEAWGGRSANRGQCAQACRLPYDLLVDGRIHDLGERAYLLSPRDLEGYRRIPELIDAGIHGFKIEGRMKSAEYVGAATALYRQAVDRAWGAGPVDHREERDAARPEPLAEEARRIFSRGPRRASWGG
jgi:putative protease